MIALYDITNRKRELAPPGSPRPTTYDFFNWLVHVKLLGATEIAFKIDPISNKKWPEEHGWPPDEAMKRFRNFILPGPALAGLPCGVKNAGDDTIGSVRMCDLVDDLQGTQPPRLRSVLPKREKRYTVTIRETLHNPQKNSDRDLWLNFADKIGAYVFEDDMRRPTDLHERVAVYAGAEMNFGVVNGPMALLYYTEYPFCIFCDPVTTAKSFSGHKIKAGDRCPFFLSTQQWVWEKPTWDNLMREAERV